MKRVFDKKKVINILFGMAVFILAANLITGEFLKGKINNNKNELKLSEIELQFISALSNLGVKGDLIQKRKGNNSPVKFSVRVPRDLPVVVILQEMNYVFDPSDVEIQTVENKLGGKTSTNFSSGDEIKLNAEFFHDSELSRKNIHIGFLVTRFEEESETDSLLLDFPERFAVVLIPSNVSSEFAKKIIERRKEYVVYLGDDIEELEYKLSDDYSASRLRNSIREIVGTFQQAVFFLVDTQSVLYKSKAFYLLKEELEKRKIILMESSNFENLSMEGTDDSSELFTRAIDSMRKGDNKILLVSAQDFLNLNSTIVKYRKMGYRFTLPSSLILE